jgi:hypothetical protein
MSKSVQLVKSSGDLYEAPARIEAGTFALTGMPQTSFHVTSNYHNIIVDATGWNGIQYLHGRRAEDTIPELRAALQLLGTKRSPDYWQATPGNVGYMFRVLLDWAQQHPTGIWHVY